MTQTPEAKLSALLRPLVKADPNQLERGETFDDWVVSMYHQKSTIGKFKKPALEIIALFEDSSKPRGSWHLRDDTTP
jgi:hypothetical protein